MSAAHPYPQLVEALDDVRRRWRVQQVLTGGLLVLGGVCVVLALVVGIDNLFHPGPLVRLLLALALWGALAAGVLTFIVRRWLEDRRDDFFAALVELKHPELHNQLINALQLGRQAPNGFSPRLIEAIVSDAASATADLDLPASLDTRPAWRAARLAAVGVLLVAGYAFALPPRFANGLARVLLPVADIPAYTATTVPDASVKPGNRRFPEGTPVLFEAKVAGVVPAAARLFRRAAGGDWQPLAMQPDPGREATFRSAAMQAGESFDYYVAAGDGRSSTFRLEVVNRPQVERLAVAYELPAYTALPPKPPEPSDGEIVGLAGSRVALELTATKPLKLARLVTEDGEPIDLRRGADDRTWAASFVLGARGAELRNLPAGTVVRAPTRYRLQMEDTDGYENGDPLWHSIALARDQAPTAVIVEPGRDIQARPDATVALAVQCKDDYGVRDVTLWYRVNDDEKSKAVLHRFAHDAGPPELQTSDAFVWNLAGGSAKLRANDRVEYWAEVTDRNDVQPRKPSESRHFTIFLVKPDEAVAKLDLQIQDYAQELEELVRLQRENRAQTESGVGFDALVKREVLIRTKTRTLARGMEKDALPVATVVRALDDLYAGLMAEAVKLLEGGRDTGDQARAADFRARSVPVQERIVRELEALLARLQRNEQAKQALRKLEKTDKRSHQEITTKLNQMIKDLDRLMKDQTELASKFERLPKRTADEGKEEQVKGLKDLEEFQKKWEKWAKGTVNELTKLPTGFVDDFGLRKDVNKIFEEIEKQANRAKAETLPVALEDLGAGLATKMKEDLEVWMPDSPDAAKWVLEEPLDKKPMKIPEMPLPKALEDMVGDLLQKAEEFDQDADDVTSAWGDNLDQAGWGVSDGPISSFSAKGKTGNDLPNNMEVTGRSGEGRRGKSSGQMVGDTVRGLQGRKTPARVGNERYEPGQLKQEGQQDPGGATGGGKKAGAGRKGLQGGTPPDFARDMGRLSEKQAGVREKAEQVARKLDTLGVKNPRLRETIELMKSAEKDLRDLRYDDAARKRRVALSKLRSAFATDQATAAQLSRARDLPPQLRTELLQAADEGYPPGYEGLLKSYFKALSSAEK